jgi:hypothetical protein
MCKEKRKSRFLIKVLGLSAKIKNTRGLSVGSGSYAAGAFWTPRIGSKLPGFSI